MDLLRGNFKPQHDVTKDEPQADAKAEYEKKAKESIGGSMVFVERKKLYHDPNGK
jgi:hypothetical protein